MFRRVGSKSWLGRLGIILLILSLGRVPLPVLELQGPEQVDAPNGSRADPRAGGGPLALGRPEFLGGCGSATERNERRIATPTGRPASMTPARNSCSRSRPALASRHKVSPGGQPQATFTASLRTPVKTAPSLWARSFAATYPPHLTASLLQRWVC